MRLRRGQPADLPPVRVRAYEAARDIRAGEVAALPTLAALLREDVTDESAAENLMAALHFAALMTPEQRGGWAPPDDATARVVADALRSGGALAEPAHGLLWVLVDRQLATTWLSRTSIAALAAEASEPELAQHLRARLAGTPAPAGRFGDTPPGHAAAP